MRSCGGILCLSPMYPRLVTLKDAYYEEHMGALIDNLLLQAHVLGGGAIGQVAFTRNDRWMFSDEQFKGRHSFGSLQGHENFQFQDACEFYSHFCFGIETIALISVEPYGVLQFGSANKIAAKKEFTRQVKEIFKSMTMEGNFRCTENEPGLMPELPSSIPHSMDQGFLHDVEGFSDANNSFFISSQFDNLFLESGNFDCSAFRTLVSSNDRSISSWPQSTPEVNGYNPFIDLVSSSLVDQQSSKDLSKAVDSASLLSPECEVRKSSGLLALEELFPENDSIETLSKSCQTRNNSQRFSARGGSNSTLTDRKSPITCVGEMNSLPSSVTNACRLKNIDDSTQGCSRRFSPVLSADSLSSTKDETENGHDQFVAPRFGSSNSLFSKLGLDHILDGFPSNPCTFSKSRIDNRSMFPVKRRKVDNLSWIQSQNKIPDSTNFEKTRSFNSEVSLKETGSSIGNICSMEAGNSKTSGEVAKNGKRKAKMGTKPRPKDRQMIQDRLLELRELIPNGEKMSIDRLLERTIRHLNFMDSLIKHFETLKQIDKPKSSGTVPNDIPSSCEGGGVTWACEVSDETMVCPLKVEDLSTPGQMLIEIQFEEQGGLFLEMADLIRGFGLIILNGVMELIETKIRAHFIVESEGNRHVTRHEIFSSLIQILQMTKTSSIGTDVSLFKRSLSFPVNLIG